LSPPPADGSSQPDAKHVYSNDAHDDLILDNVGNRLLVVG
jgi:hypothetical protein